MDEQAQHLRASEKKSQWIRKKRLWAVVVGIIGVVAGVAIGVSWKSITSSSKTSSNSPGQSSSGGKQAPSASGSSPAIAPTPTPLPGPTRVYKPGFANANPNRPIYYFVGDSITQYSSNPATYGFIDRYANDFVRSVDVMNRGVESLNTTGYITNALPILEEELTKWISPAMISVWFGVNDAAVVNGSNGSLHVPVDEYRKNLVTIIKDLQKFAPDAKVILVTPATVDDAQRQNASTSSGKAVLDHTNNQTALYAAACREVIGLVSNVTLVDPFKYFMETYPNATKRGEYQLDGLHYNADGNYLVYEMFKNATRVLFPTLTTETLQIPDFHALHDYYPENQANNTANGTVPRRML